MHLQICRVDMHKTLCLFVFFPRRQIQITLHLFNLSSCASRRLAFVVWSDLKIIGWIILQFYRCSFPPWGGGNSSLQCFFQPSSGHNFIISKSNGILDSFSSGVCNLPNIKPAETCLVTLTWQLQ